MHVENIDLGPALASLIGGGEPEEGGPRLTAVDLACCVSRHIPTVEAFVERGVVPSPAALALAEHAVPIMRWVRLHKSRVVDSGYRVGLWSQGCCPVAVRWCCVGCIPCCTGRPDERQAWALA